MTARTTYMLVTVGAALGGLGNVLTFLGGALDDAPLWRLLAHGAVVIGCAVVAVIGYRKWKSEPVRK